MTYVVDIGTTISFVLQVWTRMRKEVKYLPKFTHPVHSGAEVRTQAMQPYFPSSCLPWRMWFCTYHGSLCDYSQVNRPQLYLQEQPWSNHQHRNEAKSKLHGLPFTACVENRNDNLDSQDSQILILPKTSIFPYGPKRFKISRYAKDVLSEGNPFSFLSVGMCRRVSVCLGRGRTYC